MKKNIAVLAGDGVGPEVAREGVKVLKKIAETFDHEFIFTEGLIGAAAIDGVGSPFPAETQKLCEQSDAILFGAIGDPKYDNDPSAKIRPEQGLLAMRKALQLYANIRPIATFPKLFHKSPLKPEILEGVDIVVIRELTGGIYFGEPRGRSDNGTRAFDTCVYTKEEIERVTKYAFKIAEKRRKKLTLVDKANVLETSRLWRETVQEISRNQPEIEVDYMFVDNAAMQLMKRPASFDVIVTENMFGDILTDEASMITGSMGMLPSASIGVKTALYEPIHGSYPKAAGTNTANPFGTILSVAMLLEYSFGLMREAESVRHAVGTVIASGSGTKDIAETVAAIGTIETGDAVCRAIS